MKPGTKHRFSYLALERQIEAIGRKKKKSLYAHFIERAYEDDRVLIALMKKVLPDKLFIGDESEKDLEGSELQFDIPQNGEGKDRLSKFFR